MSEVTVTVPEGDVAAILNTQGADLNTSTIAVVEEQLGHFFGEVKDLEKRALQLTVTSEDETEKMAAAKELKKRISKIRTSAKKVKDDLKKDSLAYGKVVQGVYNLTEGVCKALEGHLVKQEKYVEIQQELRENELHTKRVKKFKDMEEYMPAMHFGQMSESKFKSIFVEAKEAYDEDIRIEQAEAEEALRKEEEAKRIREENEKLRRENSKLKAENKPSKPKNSPTKPSRGVPHDKQLLTNILKDIQCIEVEPEEFETVKGTEVAAEVEKRLNKVVEYIERILK